MRVHYKTFGCKANQYDTERMRQLIEAGGGRSSPLESADLSVINTCTVTNQADAGARRYIRRAARHGRVVVAGCSAALKGAEYRGMKEVQGVVEGHDPGEVLAAASAAMRVQGLTQLGSAAPLDRTHAETVLARSHPELVITGVHIGHYGRDLGALTLTALVRRLLDEVPGPRFRLGSIEATEIDDGMIRLLATSGGRLAPHLHMPLQSGADPVLRRMRRWHTREHYRRRAHQIAEAVSPVGLGADIITGFPGETADDHASTRDLVEELPFTYLHVFPYSPRDGTVAADLPDPVPQRISRERGLELRELAGRKAARYARGRGGEEVVVVMEGRGGTALTGDYLRVAVDGRPHPGRLHAGRLSVDGVRVTVLN